MKLKQGDQKLIAEYTKTTEAWVCRVLRGQSKAKGQKAKLIMDAAKQIQKHRIVLTNSLQKLAS